MTGAENPRRVDREYVQDFIRELGLDPEEVAFIQIEAHEPILVNYTVRSDKDEETLPFRDHQDALLEFIEGLGVDPNLVTTMTLDPERVYLNLNFFVV